MVSSVPGNEESFFISCFRRGGRHVTPCGREKLGWGACRGPGLGCLGEEPALSLAPQHPQPGDRLDLAQLHSTAPPLSSPCIPPPLSSSLPRLPGFYLHSFYLLAFFSCCFTLCLIIALHFLLYLKSKIMLVSCIHFGNKIYGNACH